MALLTEAVGAKSSFPQMAQQLAAQQQREGAQSDAEKRRAEAERQRKAKEKGLVVAGVQGLQGYQSLYKIGQRLYDDYNAADQAGNIEEAEAIKSMLMKFSDQAAGYARSEMNTFNAISSDPEKQKMFNNSLDQIGNILAQNQSKEYEIKREGLNYTVVDPDGNSYDLFGMPEMRGESFVGQLDHKPKVPSYVSSVEFGEKLSGTILNRSDVVDQETGKIKDPDQARRILSDKLRTKITATPEFIDGLIYDYQSRNGEMDTYDQNQINNLKTDASFIEEVKSDYIDTAYNTLVQYQKPKEDKAPASKVAEKMEQAIMEIPIVGGAADFTQLGSQIKYMKPGGGLTVINKLKPTASGLTSTQSVMVDADGNPVSKEDDAVGYSEIEVKVTPGTEEWNRLAAAFGGEDYLNKLLLRANPELSM